MKNNLEIFNNIQTIPLFYIFFELKKQFNIYKITSQNEILKNILVNLNTHLLFKDHDWYSINITDNSRIEKREKCFRDLIIFLKEISIPIKTNNDNRYKLNTRIPIRILDQFDNNTSDVFQQTLNITKSENNYIFIKKRKLLDVSGFYGVNIIGSTNYETLLKNTSKNISLGVYSKQMKNVDKLLIQLCDFQRKHNYSQTELYYKKIENVVSYHNSGTEAVEAVLRLTKYNTKKNKFVTFDTTYHGWSSQMISGISSINNKDNLKLPFLNIESLSVIQDNAYSISCVLFNPMCIYKIRQNDILLEIDKTNVSKTHDINEINEYLIKLEKICSLYDIALVFDEIYSAFRFGPSLLSTQYIKAKPDIIIIGKTIGCGIPCGIAIGNNHYLQRQKENEGYNKSVIQGTFSNSTMLSNSIELFLNYITTQKKKYKLVFNRMDKMIQNVNNTLLENNVQIKLCRYGLLITTDFLNKSPYHFLLQFYLMKHNIFTCCYGTSRMNLNLSFRENELMFFETNFIDAVLHMKKDSWFYGEKRNLSSNIYLCKLLGNTILQKYYKEPYDYIMLAKKIDLDVSHHNRINFMTHYFSSLLTLYSYFLFFIDEKYKAMYLFLFCQIVRQMGHFLFEVPNEEAENAKIGFNNSSKKLTITLFILLSILTLPINGFNPHKTLLRNLIIVMCLKIANSSSQIGVEKTILWIIKIITDIITDLDDMGPKQFMDFFTDDKVRYETLNEIFIPKYMKDGKLDLLKIIQSYLGINFNYNSKLLE
jgi:acetylornithine/succinyldiaminopimelate/putrescine aminotransferase